MKWSDDARLPNPERTRFAADSAICSYGNQNDKLEKKLDDAIAQKDQEIRDLNNEVEGIHANIADIDDKQNKLQAFATTTRKKCENVAEDVSKHQSIIDSLRAQLLEEKKLREALEKQQKIKEEEINERIERDLNISLKKSFIVL